MNKPISKLVFETPENTQFKVRESQPGELTISVSHLASLPKTPPSEAKIAPKDPPPTSSHTTPPIPEGYAPNTERPYDAGFTVRRESDGSQFVWIPVDCLSPAATIDGHDMRQRFGLRYQVENIYPHNALVRRAIDEHIEPLTPEFQLQVESVKTYGGFYLSSYYISSDQQGKPHSVLSPGVIEANFRTARAISMELEEDNPTVSSHLLYGSEYDSVHEWLILQRMSNNRGPRELGIFDFAGRQEWTQERAGNKRIIRNMKEYWFGVPPYARKPHKIIGVYSGVSFRAALYIR